MPATDTSPAGPPRLEILLLCDRHDQPAATIERHIDALVGKSRHRVRPLSMLGDLPAKLDLERFDVIAIHYTLTACNDSYLSPRARTHIGAAKALKAVFIQDEYRFVDRTIAAFRELGIKVLFTCVPEDETDKVYPAEKLPRVQKVNVLTGYVDESLVERDVPPLADRPIDVGHRGRKLPAWLGDLGQEKWKIGERFLADAKRYALACDISHREEDRFYGHAWYNFLSRCKAVLGVESSTSVFDFTGEIQRQVERDQRENPAISYEELRERHFGDTQGLIRLNQISPRCFEAAALRTLMILYPGAYSGLLKPWRHYVPLEKDHSNMEEVVSVLRDEARRTEIIENAYQEVARNPECGYGAFVAKVDAAVDAAFAPAMGRRREAYSNAAFDSVSAPGFTARRRRLQRRVQHKLRRLVFGVLLRRISYRRRDRIEAALRRVKLAILALLRSRRRQS